MKNLRHNIYLDGFRGIAIIMVMCYHYFYGHIIFDFGWSGVDLFFVLSGFLLSGRLYPYLADRQLLKKFYVNRFLRIIPLFYTFLVIFFIIGYSFPGEITEGLNFYKAHIFSFFVFLANWLYIFNPNRDHHYLKHIWSLAVEEQFYIFFPLLILLIREKKKIIAGRNIFGHCNFGEPRGLLFSRR